MAFAPYRPAAITGVGHGWVSFAVILLTSAMFAQASIVIFEVHRANVLAFDYFVWAISAAFLLLVLRSSRPVQANARSFARKSLVAFLLALFASTFLVWLVELRPNINDVIAQTAALAYMTLPFFVLHAAARATDVDRAVLLTCHIILGLSMLSILGDFTGLTSYEHLGGRYFGFLGDQSAWALTLPLLVYFSSKKLFLAGVAAVGLALTASRGPALCAVAALLVLLTFSRGRRLQYILTIAFMAFVALYQSEVFATLADRFGATYFGSSDRMITARTGLKIFEDSPLFGSGYNSLTYLMPSNARRLMLGQLPTQTSHLVQMLSDGGLLLFLPYLAFAIAVTVAGATLLRRQKSLADRGVINGVIAWLLAMLWVNQSAAWFVVGSYVGPLVFGMAGIVSGYWSRIPPSRATAAPASF
jgi:O-antigen ligase